MPFEPGPDRVLIVGAGIAGLSAAIALSLAGEKVIVLEKSEPLEEIGAGIQLGPNAVRLLDAWGVTKYLKHKVIAPKGVALYYAPSGELLNRVPLEGCIEHRHGAPFWVVHRADLQQSLLKRLQELDSCDVVLGFRFEMYKYQNNHVCILREDGNTLCGKAILGADGIWSQIRQQIVGFRGQPKFAGKTAWRALIDRDALPDGLWNSYTGVWMAPNAHIVHYPVRGGAKLNIVAIIDDSWRDRVWASPGRRDDLLAHFTSWALEPQKLLQIPQTWSKWPLYRQHSRAHWPLAMGPVAMIGDAGHPVLPFLAQGAAMAIEDAAVLAAHFRETNRPVAARLQAYASARQRRVQRVQAASARMGHVYHLRGPLRWARNEILKRRKSSTLLASLDWLYGYRPETINQPN